MRGGWVQVRIGDLLTIQNGFAFDSKKFSTSKGVPLIRIRDLKNGRETETKYSGSFDGRYEVASGDLLIGMDGEFGCYEWKGGKALLNQRVCRIQEFSDRLEPRFLFYGINRYLKEIEDATTYTTVKHLSSKQISNIKIPLPSRAEQQRIVSLLDEAFAGLATATANTEKNLKNARKLFEATLVSEIFGDADEQGWEPTTVAYLASCEKGSIRTGPFGSQLLHGEFVEDGIAVLGIDNAVANEFRWGKSRFITPAKFAQLSRYRVRPGDVLITIMGTCGRCAIVPDDIPAAINTKHLCCITLDRSRCLPEYLHAYFLYHPVARTFLREQAKGSIMEGLNMGIIQRLPVRLPSIATQRSIIQSMKSLSQGTSTAAHWL